MNKTKLSRFGQIHDYRGTVDKCWNFAYNFAMERGSRILLLLLVSQQILGAINPDGIFHDPGDIFYVNPQSGDIRLKAERGNIESAYVIIGTESVMMNIAYQDTDFDYYAVQLNTFETTLSYRFFLTHGSDSLMLPPEGAFRPASPPLMIPNWAAGKVYYSICVDGFYNGDTLNDPPDVNEWGAKPNEWLPYGGDLKGLVQRIEYIQSLGADIILLSPLFTATSNHKLNPRDYGNIDPAYGDTNDLKNVIDAIHNIGKKVILSTVLTHTGNDFPAFTDIVTKGDASRYIDWYRIQSLPSDPTGLKYRSWRSDMRFPMFNLRNRQLQSYLIGFVDYWAHFGCDGFYIGETEIDEGFAGRLYAQVKAKYPNSLIISSDYHSRNPHIADGHYRREFSQVMIDYFVNSTITTAEFDSIIHHMLFFNPAQINRSNIIGAVSYSKRIREIADNELLELIYAFLLTFCGSPLMQYGDEVGMTECAPLNWGSFPWSSTRQDRQLLGKLRSLIRIRRENDELQSSNFFTLYVDDVSKVYAYDRGGIIVVLNCSSAQSFVELPAWDGTYSELPSGSKLTAYSQTLKLSIEPMSYRILKREI